MQYPLQGLIIHIVFLLAQPTYVSVRFLLDRSYFASLSYTWLAITVSVWLYIVTQLSIPFFTNPLLGLPSPPGVRFLIGHLNYNGGKPPTDIITDMFKSTPNDGLLLLWLPFYRSCEIIPTRPEVVMEMMNTRCYDWEKPSVSRKLLRRVIGDGLVNVEGNEHKAMRRVVAPAFSGKHIRELVPLFYTKGVAFADSLAREISRKGQPLDMVAAMSRVTLDIIGVAGAGKDFNTIERDDDPLAQSYEIITNDRRGPMILFILMFTVVPEWIVRHLRGTPWAVKARAQQKLRKDVRALMQQKKQQMKEEKAGGDNSQKDILAIIMRSGEFSDDYLTDQLLTFLGAGHDTTSSALSWTTWFLSKHPNIQDRLRAECNAHLGDTDPTRVDASIFEAENMPYLHAVCNEVLRLYPSAPNTDRVAVRQTKIGDRTIPAGTMALISPWALNRDKSLWGADAEQFNPERWLSGPNAANGGAKSAATLMTFIHGPRSCIGQQFARSEMKCILAALVLRFRMEMANSADEIHVGGMMIIKPAPHLRLNLYDLKAEKGKKETEKANGVA